MKVGKRPKILDLIRHERELVEKGSLRYSAHAEEMKDKFNEDYDLWDYAIEGKTIDNRKLHIIIALVEPNILVVTAIKLDNLWKEK